MKKMRKRADRLPSLNVFSLMSNKTVNILVRITGTPLSKEEYVLDARTTLIEVKNVATQGLTGQLQRYLNMGIEKNIIYVRLGTKISAALKASSYIIKYFPW